MDEIIIVEYDPRWVKQYEEESARIWQILGSRVVRIEHFGSTAVPGLAAKPIVDLLVEVHSLENIKSAIGLIEALGYVYWQSDPRPGRMFFVKGMPPYGLKRTHHLHLVETGSDIYERLLFRDYLRLHPDEAQRYAALKHKLASRFKSNREAYTKAKSDYILAVIEKARLDTSANNEAC